MKGFFDIENVCYWYDAD